MKAIIWDLDETLWEGTVYHKESVKLKQETREILKKLDKLGPIILKFLDNTQNTPEPQEATKEELWDILTHIIIYITNQGFQELFYPLYLC